MVPLRHMTRHYIVHPKGDSEQYLGHLLWLLALKDFVVIALEMSKILILSVSLGALLSGCATPKPAMPNDMYDNFAKAYLTVQRCGTSGQMSPDTAAWAKKMLNYKVDGYSYDPAFLNGRAQAINSYLPNPPTEVCNQLAMMSVEYKQMVQAHNAQVEADTRAVEAQIQNNRPVNTYCNQIGTQTLCNSY